MTLGVVHYWLVDPRVRMLQVYRLENGRYTLVDAWEGDAKVRAEPIDAIELNLASRWAVSNRALAHPGAPHRSPQRSPSPTCYRADEPHDG